MTSFREPLLVVRSLFFWALSVLHFFPVGAFLVALGVVVDPRRNDRAQRIFLRNVLRFAGVRFRVVRAPGFDPERTSFFVCNHVNLFDPMTIYSAIPQFVRGLELESHFRVPVYGWMMRRFGNVPVPDEPTAGKLELLKELCREKLADGISLIVFPEGSRTPDGRLGRFKSGVFRMAREFGVPIVPMSIVGAFEFKRKGSWMLRPSTITVYLHDTLETRDLTRRDEARLLARVREIVDGPIAARYGESDPRFTPRTGRARRSAAGPDPGG